ncbi:Golgin subfamily A member 7/ERF4 family-domain-containing protein [Astrocystis sublimbata]|nr:Golgin subfamily A member 7/ERF4 family-domain-containing protein [Astrocystis sublimbata]
MHVLEQPIPACMNSSLSNLPLSPLNVNPDAKASVIRARQQQSRIPSRRGGFAFLTVVPTASRDFNRSNHIASPTVGASGDSRNKETGQGTDQDKADIHVSVSHLPANTSTSNRNDKLPVAGSAVRPQRSRRHRARQTPQGPDLAPSSRFLSAPFRNRAVASDPASRVPRSRGAPGRLWNPTNSTPRLPPAIYTRPTKAPVKRRPSTPPLPIVPLNHPALDDTRAPDEQGATGAGDYPLLTLPEQRQSRHSTPTPTPTRSSFQIEERLNEGKRVALPSSVHHSYNIRERPDGPSGVGSALQLANVKLGESSFAGGHLLGDYGETTKSRTRATSFGLVRLQSPEQPARKLDKGKGKAIMTSPNHDSSPRGLSTDLERGPSVLDPKYNRSNLSIPNGGIGSAISSSNSSIIGDPDQPGLGDEWGPQHPCYPHLNPYVPLESTEYQTTRIIRVRRDWLVAGDLAPTFSNMYPEILDPAGISEQEFRRVIEKLNGTLLPTFNPYNWRNILDGVLGVLTAWVWEDLGFTNAKTKLRELEKWIEKWNTEMEKTTGSDEAAIAPKIISLRRTGYMSLDFQIPNPEVSISNSEPASRSGPSGSEPALPPAA